MQNLLHNDCHGLHRFPVTAYPKEAELVNRSKRRQLYPQIAQIYPVGTMSPIFPHLRPLRPLRMISETRGGSSYDFPRNYFS